jgi:phosphoglucomutase
MPDVRARTRYEVFRSSGHSGTGIRSAFSETDVRAITQAICDYRHQHGIDGPLFIARDSHVLSQPAFVTAVEVLTVGRVHVRLEPAGGYAPAPAVARAILTHNRQPFGGVADGILVTSAPSSPGESAVKYIPPNGGPADIAVTRWIEERANRLLVSEGGGTLSYLTYARARRPNTTQGYDYVDSYVHDLADVIDMDAIRYSGLRIGVDVLGGSAGAVWAAIADRYAINIDGVNSFLDPTFRFTEQFDIVIGNGADTHGHRFATRSGVMDADDYLAVAIAYLFTHRPAWSAELAVGKVAVGSSLIDRVASGLKRRVVEVPSGFKWFVPGLLAGSLGFAGEESAAASFLQRDGTPWTTDTDGIVMDLLAVELMARTDHNPSEFYAELTTDIGMPLRDRIDVPAAPEELALLACLSPHDVTVTKLAGDRIAEVLTVAPGNGIPLGGLKVTTANGWFAARPSGTANYELYAETFRGRDHLQRIQTEARTILSRALVRGLR